ncbi:VOC family protein [Piscinibacter sakaiensis]|uniref:VOC family protein n=1 Tax=Piscinibacter sakaiensis TaxID=1547922 RepID=UPI003AAB6D8B
MDEPQLSQQVLKLGAARVFVYDLAAAHAFYSGKLGLRLKTSNARFGYLVYDAGRTELVVGAVAPDAKEDDHAMVGRVTGLSFYVDNIAAMHRALLAREVFFSAPPKRQPWGGIMATFADPAGNQLNLLQLRG